MLVKRKIYKVRLRSLDMKKGKTKLKILKALSTNWDNIERIRKKTQLNWFSVKAELVEMYCDEKIDGLERIKTSSDRHLYRVTPEKYKELHKEEEESQDSELN